MAKLNYYLQFNSDTGKLFQYFGTRLPIENDSEYTFVPWSSEFLSDKNYNLINNEVVVTPIEEEVEPEEIKIIKIRSQRDFLLANSDWTQLPDVSDENKQKWATYRQLLRDFPSTEYDLENPVWPTPPS